MIRCLLVLAASVLSNRSFALQIIIRLLTPRVPVPYKYGTLSLSPCFQMSGARPVGKYIADYKLDTLHSKIIWIPMILNHICWPNGVIQSDQQDLTKSRGTSSVNLPMPIDTFTVPLHNPNGRQMPAVRAVQMDCHWSLNNGGNPLWSREPIMQWGTRQPQSIFRPTNHKSVIPVNRRLGLILLWQSYCREARTVKQSTS